MKNTRILIVEDDAISVASLKQIVEQMGYEVAGIAASGEEGVSLAKSEIPDVALMDIRLRGKMSGIEAAEQIRAQLDVPVIYLTAYSEDNLLDEASETQPYGYLVKPVRDRELRASIETALYKAEADRRLKHLNQMLRSVREVNQLITREKDRQTLLHEACQVLYQVHDYRLVWIGMVEGKGEKINAVAWAGEDTAFIGETDGNREEIFSEFPGLTAVQKREAVVCQDNATETSFTRWREEAMAYGFRSSGYAPIMHETQVFGVLCVLSDRTNAFSPEELELLQELAADLGFAMYNIELEAERKRAEEALRSSEERFSTVFKVSPIGISITRITDGQVVDANPTFLEMFGFTRGEVVGRTTQELKVWADPEERGRVISSLREQGWIYGYETKGRRKNGEIFDIFVSAEIIELTSEPHMLSLMQDVTERRKAEGALRESEQRFRLLVEQAPLGYQSLDEDGNFIYVNQALLELMGYQREEVLGRWFGDFIAPSCIEDFKQSFSRFKLKGETHNELTLMRKDGSPVIVDIYGKIGYDERGKFIQTHCLLTDITERKRAEEALEASEARYRSLVEQAGAGIALINNDGQISFANETLLNMVGYTQEEIMGKPFSDILHPDDLTPMFQLFQEASVKPGEGSSLECRIIHREGYPIDIQASPAPILIKGELSGFGAVIHDIRERKRVEEALRESEERFRQIVDHAVAGYFRLDEQGRYVQVNDAWLKMHGYDSADEVIGQSYTLTQVEADLEEATRLGEQILSGKPLTSEFSRRNKDGSVGYHNFSSRPILKEGKVIGLEGFLIDATERKRVEKALQESEERFRRMAENAQDLIYRYDFTPQPRFTYVSPAATSITGYSPEDHYADPQLGMRMVHPDDLPLLEQYFQGEGVFHTPLTLRWVRKDGTTIFTEQHNVPIYDDKGNLVALEGIARDITERKKTEEALQSSEKHFRALIENSSEGILLLSPQLEIIYDSTTSGRILGYKGEVIVGSNLADWIHPQDMPFMTNLIVHVLKEPHKEFRTECRIKHKDGSWIWVEGSLTNLLTESSVQALVVNYHDITERKQAEDALRHSETDLKKAQAVANVGSWAWRIQSNQLEWSDQMYRIFGIDKESFTGDLAEVIARAVHPEDRAAVEQANLLVLQDKKPTALEYRVIWPDGRVRAVYSEDGELILDEAGKPLVITGIVQDITNRKQAEEDLRESEEKYRNLVERANDGITIIQDSIVRFANARMAEMWQGAVEEIVDKPFSEYTHPDELANVTARYMRRMAGEAVPPTYETTLLRKDGSTFPAELNAGVINYMGRPADLVLVRDITRRKQDEQALRESEQRYRSLFEGVPVGLYRTSLEGNILEVNTTLVQMLGYPDRQSMLATNATDLYVNPEDRQRHVDRMEVAQDSIELEMQLHKFDGQVIWVRDIMRAVRDGSGRVQYFEGNLEDISLRKQAEEALKKRNRELSMLNETALAISSQHSLDAVLRTVAEQLTQAMDSSGCTLSIWNREMNVVETLFDHSVMGTGNTDQRGVTYDLVDYPKTHLVLKTGESLLMQRNDPLIDEAEAALMDKYEIKTLMMAPLIVGDRTIGLAEIYDELHIRDYSPEEIRLAQSMASQAAVAIENARLYEQAQQEILERKRAEEQIRRRAEEFASLYDTARDLAEQTDLSALLQTIVQRTASLLGTMSSMIYLFDPKRGDLFVGAASNPIIPLGVRLALGEGAAGRVANTRKPLFIKDYGNWEGRSPQYEGLSFTTVIQAPMIYQGELVGVISADNFALESAAWEERDFDEEDANLLSTFASQAASAVYNARLLDATRQRLAELEVLYEGGLSFGQLLQPEDMGQKIVEVIGEKMAWHHAALRLYNPQNETLRLIAFSQPGIADEKERQAVRDSFEKKVSKTDQGLAGWAVKSGMTIRCADVTQDKHYVETHPTIRSGLYVPLKIGNRILGVISVESEERNAFSEADERLLETLMSQAAIALDNARLLGDARRRLQRTVALRDIDIVISSSLDLKLTFKSILDRTIEQLEVDAADILLLDQETAMLEYAAGNGFRTPALQYTRLQMGEGYAGIAALEKRRIYIPELHNRKTDFLRSPHFLSESFVAYYAVPLIAKGSVRGVLEIFHRSPILADQEWLDFMETLAGQAAIAIDSISLFNDLQRSNAELSMAYDATIEGWSRALDLRDKETEGHTQRVTEMTLRLARDMGIKDEGLLHVQRGALLHDIGKMGVPDSILNKPGSLTDEERKLMSMHPIFAHEMLSPIVYLRLALDIPYCHHEKWDGTGYPRGLKGEQIPLAARIFAVVDVYDALISDRPYRFAWSKEKAIEYITEQSGKHFDPVAVKAFLMIFGS